MSNVTRQGSDDQPRARVPHSRAPDAPNAADFLVNMDERLFAPVLDVRLSPNWTPRLGVDGGRYLNPRDGGSLEFKQHRSYGPGDDVRRVDWAVYGRTKKLFTRLVDAEHTPALIIAIDHSASMAAGGAEGKFSPSLEYALMLAYVALSSDYRVTLVPFGPSATQADGFAKSITLVHPRQILSLARARLGQWGAQGGTDFGALGQQSLGWRRRGASVVIVSDFLIDIDDAQVPTRGQPTWLAGLPEVDAQTFAKARPAAQRRILASLDQLHRALEPLDTPNVRAALLSVTGAGEQSLIAARSVFDMESGFLQRVLFTRASERAYQAARTAHSLALGAMAASLGLGHVAVPLHVATGGAVQGRGRASNDTLADQTANRQKRQAVLEIVDQLGFGPSMAVGAGGFAHGRA